MSIVAEKKEKQYVSDNARLMAEWNCLGDTNCIGKSAADSVDLLNVLLRNAGSAVENDGELGKSLLDLLENIEAERGRNKDTLLVSGALLGSELVCAVGGTDRDSEGVNAGLGYELLNLFGTGVGGMLCNNVVLNASENAKLTLNNNSALVSVLNYLLGEGNVVLEGVVRAVDHNRGEASVDASLADLEICAVVKVESEVNAAVLYCRLGESEKILVLCVLTCACRYLKDNGGFFLCRSLGDRLNDLHVVDVEGTDGVAACVGLLEHFSGCYESHI